MAIVGATMQIAFWSIIVPVGILVLSQLFKTAFYTIGTMLFWIIDLLQTVFRKLAGLETTWIDGEEGTGDVLLNVLKSQVVVDTLISVTVFAVALVIIATIVQMVRTEYTTEGSKNSKEGIIGKALKSLVMFILIPVVCLFGIRTSNYLLKAVDSATSGGGSSSISGSIFLASATNANRISNKDVENDFNIDEISIVNLLKALTGNYSARLEGDNGDYYVKHYDNIFKSNAGNKEKARHDIGQQIDSAMSMPLSDNSLMMHNGIVRISYQNVTAVKFFYSIGSINIIVLYVGCYLVLKSLFSAALGMIVRIYKCTALFIIAPAAIGLQPLDDGSAYKKWKGQFISNVLSAYGIVVGLNVFFVVSGIVSKIQLFDPSKLLSYTVNRFMQAFFVVAGATQLNAIAKMMGDLIGAADAMSDGAGVIKGVGELTSGMGKMAGGAAKMGAGFASKVRENKATRQAKAARNELAAAEGLTYDKSSGETEEAFNARKEQARAAATKKLQQAEVARQVNRNRAKAAFGSTQIGQMFSNVTGGVASVMNGDWAKGTDEKSLAKLKSSGIDPTGAIGDDYVDAINKKDAKTGKRALLHVATGGSLVAAGAISGLGAGIDGAIKGFFRPDPATGKRGGFKGAGKGFVSAADVPIQEFSKASKEMFDPIVSAYDTAFGDAHEGNVAKSNKSAVAASTRRSDAIATVKEQADAQRKMDAEAKHQTMLSAESNNSALYSGQKSFADTSLSAVGGLLGAKGSGAISSANASKIRNKLNTLQSASFEGSEVYGMVESILNQIGTTGGISSAIADAVRDLFKGIDKDFMSREFATSTSETRASMKSIHASMVETDKMETAASKNINGTSIDPDGDIDQANIDSLVKQFTQDMTKFEQGNKEALQDAVKQALAAGVTIKGTDGKPLEVNSKAFVDAINDLKRATEEASSKKQDKEMVKTMQDMLKELKKKK